MKDEYFVANNKTKKQLVNELAEMRQRITELEASEIYHKRVEKALKRRVAELSALNTMATIIDESLNVEEILNRAIDEVLWQIGVEAASMLLFDEKTGEQVLVAHRGVSDEFVRTFSRPRLGEGLSGLVMQTGEPVVIGDLTNYPDVRKAYVEKERIQSAAVVPLIGHTNVIGAMNLAATGPHYFNAANLELSVALGLQIAIGVENAQLSQEVFRAIAENTNDGILIATGKSILVYANKQAVEITGYSVAELLNTSIKNLLYPDEFEKIMKRYRAVNGKPAPRLHETVIIRKNGEVVPVEVTSANIAWRRRPADMVIIRDIAKRKQAEKQLKEYSEKLEEMVEERTKEFQETQEQLMRREKIAILDQLVNGIGHELRNALGVIKNTTYFIQTALEEPEQDVKKCLEILEKEVARSESIISSLFNFTRPKPPTRLKVNINHIVQEALFNTTVPENVEVVSQLDVSLPAVMADPDQLRQVFGNIILNAIQAMPEGGQLVVKSKVQGTEWVVVSFADTGVGIPEENLGRIFEPLFTTRHRRIGLGLAVVRTLVEGHRGVIEVQSELGKGSIFTVRIQNLEKV